MPEDTSAPQDNPSPDATTPHARRENPLSRDEVDEAIQSFVRTCESHRRERLDQPSRSEDGQGVLTELADMHPGPAYGCTFHELVRHLQKRFPGITVGDTRPYFRKALLATGCTTAEIKGALSGAWFDPIDRPGGLVTERLTSLVEQGKLRLEIDTVPDLLDGKPLRVCVIRGSGQSQQARQPARRTQLPKGHAAKASAPQRASRLKPDPEAYLPPADLARIFDVPLNSLRQRLKRWRRNNLDTGWIENSERKSREAKYLYKVRAVQPVIQDLQKASTPTNEATNKRPSTKK